MRCIGLDTSDEHLEELVERGAMNEKDARAVRDFRDLLARLGAKQRREEPSA